MTKRTKAKQAEMAEAQATLRTLLNPGDTVYCVLRNVSRSGMSRHIDFYTLKEGEPRWLSSLMARALDYRQAERGDALKVSGCGMDMGFHVVYVLGQTLWPQGTDKPHGTRNSEPDSTGGYALKSRWL